MERGRCLSHPSHCPADRCFVKCPMDGRVAIIARCGMAQLTDLPPDQLRERAQKLRELGDVWRYLLWELADALEVLAQEKQQNREE